MAEDAEVYVDDVAFCEGGSNPLEGNRTGELAMECWNLRKTLMEQGSQSMKLKREVKSQKNLVKSLQKCVTECETESLLKTKDIHAKKITILQLEKKVHELTTNNSFLNSSFIRSKKLATHLQHKLDDSQKECQLLLEKFDTMSASLKDELRSQESALCLEIRKVSEERDRHFRELAVQKTYLDESTVRINDLDVSSRELKAELETQSKKYGDSLARIAREQEKSYDQLHARLEKIWTEREVLCKKLIDKEHENHQLMSFILMEGLQLPELLPVAASVYEAVAEKYPAGSSSFEEGVPLLGGGMLSNEFTEQAEGSDDGYDIY